MIRSKQPVIRARNEALGEVYEGSARGRRRRAVREEAATVLEGSGDPGLVGRAARLRGCCSVFAVRASRLDPARSRPVPVNRCHDRLCPSCAAARAAAWGERVRPLLDEARRAGGVPKFITLTQCAREGESLRDARARLERAFGALRRRRSWGERVRGFVAAREATWKGSAWHVHIHLVADADYWSQRELSAEWEAVTGGESRVVDIRQARAGAELELIKYALKTAAVPPVELLEFALAMRGARMVSTGGAWHGRVREADVLSPAGEAAGAEFELISFEDLERGRAGGDPWAAAVLDAVDAWILDRVRGSGGRLTGGPPPLPHRGVG